MVAKTVESIRIYRGGYIQRRPLIADDPYRRLLNTHFRDLPQKEIEFFINPRRFNLFRSLMRDRLNREIDTILNVACGPFALENYVRECDGKHIDAFDIDERLNGMFRELRRHGGFDHVNFSSVSAEDFSRTKQYDLVLISDLFYHKDVRFDDLIDGYGERVRPGGYLYFDIVDVKARWLWKLLGKDGRFARYDLDAVSDRLEEMGFEILSMTPSLGVGGRIDRGIRAVMQALFGIANSCVFVARKIK